jgi:hypothetical protein
MRLLEHGTATADDVAERLGDIPHDIDPRWLGTVPGQLAKAGIIRAVGHVKSGRPSRNASLLTVWGLVGDHAVARHWLATHPELPGPPPEDEGDAGAALVPSAPTPTPSPSQAVQS